ncbi:hypothetical protein HPB51_000280 [Rhipicephalus microplus]|uniref:Uncharacterized protein n=1 Tax=Rhipicephalus microplus TaxID=6941 RepID=A0A9J6EVF2_RHIMP|nr:hypothetical protein HPB51_000280 [Rhipicephalus microplus]
MDFLSTHSALIDCAAGTLCLELPLLPDSQLPNSLCTTDFFRIPPKALTFVELATPSPVVDGSTEEEMRPHLLFTALAAFALLNSGYAVPHEGSSSEDSNAIAEQDDHKHDDGGFPKEQSQTETEKNKSDPETSTSSPKDSSKSHQDEAREENLGSSKSTTGADSGSQHEELEQKDDSEETTTECGSTSEGDNGSQDEEGDKNQDPSETTKPVSTGTEADSENKDEQLDENENSEETTTECNSTSTEEDKDSQAEQREEKEGSDSTTESGLVSTVFGNSEDDKESSPLKKLSDIFIKPIKNLAGK